MLSKITENADKLLKNKNKFNFQQKENCDFSHYFITVNIFIIIEYNYRI